MYDFTLDSNGTLMAAFEINEVEEKTLKNLIDSIKVLYGDDVKYDVKYLMSHTGIGVHVDVIITSNEKLFIPIKKDITDYDSW